MVIFEKDIHMSIQAVDSEQAKKRARESLLTCVPPGLEVVRALDAVPLDEWRRANPSPRLIFN